MTITRLALVTGETVSTNEFIALGGSDASISTSRVHSGNYAIRFPSVNSRTIAVGLVTLPDVIRSNYFINHTGGPGTTGYIYSVHSAGESIDEIYLRWDQATDTISLSVHNVLVASISAAVIGIDSLNIWIPLGIYIESGVSGKVVFYVDGIEVLRYDGTILGNFDYITAGGGSPRSLITGGWNTMYLDDWYVEELSGGNIGEASPPSPQWMVSVVENRASTEWTPFGATNNDDCVDDPAAHDGDATYVYTGEDNKTDLYALSSIILPVNYVIQAVVPFALARKTDAGLDAQLRFVSNDGPNTGDGGTVFLPVSYRPVYGRFTTQPNGSDWNEADFNARRFGFESEFA